MMIDGVIRTKHRHGRCIAESLATDNLSEMSTHAEGEYVITRITSNKVRSVIASMDDYLMNLAVAESVCERLHQNAELCNKKPAEPEKMKSKESMSEHMHQS